MKSHNVKSSYGFRNIQEKEFPPLVQIAMVQYLCNAKCPRCPVGISSFKEIIEKRKKASTFISSDIFKKIAKEVGQYHRTILRLHGRGDPLLHPNICELVDFSKNVAKVNTVTLFTNGIKLNKNISKSLLEANLDVFDISLDAHNSEIYKQNRGVDKWDIVYKNMLNLINERDSQGYNSKIIVSAVLDDIFEPVSQDFVNFWEELGVDKAILRPFHTYAGKLIKKMKLKNKFHQIPCPQPFTRFSINTNGEVNYCFHDWEDNHIINSILNNSIKEIWNSEKMKIYRDKELQGISHCDLCSNCNINEKNWTFSYELLLKKMGIINWDDIPE